MIQIGDLVASIRRRRRFQYAVQAADLLGLPTSHLLPLLKRDSEMRRFSGQRLFVGFVMQTFYIGRSAHCLSPMGQSWRMPGSLIFFAGSVVTGVQNRAAVTQR